MDDAQFQRPEAAVPQSTTVNRSLYGRGSFPGPRPVDRGPPTTASSKRRIERLRAYHMKRWLFGGRTDLTDLDHR